MFKIGIVILTALCLVSAAFAGTEYLTKGHYILGLGMTSDIFGGLLLGGPEDVAMITVEPEFGYFFAGRTAVITALGITAYWIGDYDYQHLQWSAGVEYDAPLHERLALFFRFVGGIDYDSEKDDVSPLFGPSFGAKVFLVPQTPLWFGYGYQGVVETSESGNSELLSRHGITFGLQIIL
ncbi:MAG: hypothetical protein JSU81_01625 [Candidatus Coatesbacteria bacterium]|nr:MAG: hypothetical protein JSU81_01625 [Candidatus Coatesbacteria bacterium]